ncbi:hypothetical protein [Lonepinella sp. MS14436]|uniref:hypothetical protein n=1 Tax=Lonepinella sp. MS14436 TaxID=3003619 RepID=UPI0036DA8760
MLPEYIHVGYKKQSNTKRLLKWGVGVIFTIGLSFIPLNDSYQKRNSEIFNISSKLNSLSEQQEYKVDELKDKIAELEAKLLETPFLSYIHPTREMYYQYYSCRLKSLIAEYDLYEKDNANIVNPAIHDIVGFSKRIMNLAGNSHPEKTVYTTEEYKNKTQLTEEERFYYYVNKDMESNSISQECLEFLDKEKLKQ